MTTDVAIALATVLVVALGMAVGVVWRLGRMQERIDSGFTHINQRLDHQETAQVTWIKELQDQGQDIAFLKGKGSLSWPGSWMNCPGRTQAEQ